MAQLVAETVEPRWIGLDRDSWGLDHGTWSVLAHMFPDADVPVVQLSINALQPLEYHLDIGARLAPLQHHGVLVVASGNVVHNLRRIAWDEPSAGFDWARRFDEAARQVMADAPGDVLGLVEHDDYGLAVPTPDHFIPLVYIGALAAETSAPPAVLIEGYAYGSLSMTCFAVGADCPSDLPGDDGTELPRPDLAPPEQSNI